MGADFGELEALATALGETALVRGKASQVVRKAAADVTAHAKMFAPVDTGNLRQSIITRTVDDLTSEIISGADYAIFQEYGTRFQPGTAHMRPALERVEPSFVAAIEQLGDTL